MYPFVLRIKHQGTDLVYEGNAREVGSRRKPTCVCSPPASVSINFVFVASVMVDGRSVLVGDQCLVV